MTVFDLLGVVLMVLKLGGVISWSWWIIAIPFIPSILVYSFLLLMLVLGFITGLLS